MFNAFACDSLTSNNDHSHSIVLGGLLEMS